MPKCKVVWLVIILPFSANRHIQQTVVKSRYLLLPLGAQYSSHCELLRERFFHLNKGKSFWENCNVTENLISLLTRNIDNPSILT